MRIVLFDFPRNLKITHFTINVLTRRLDYVESPRDGTSDEGSRFAGLVHESIAACDPLHDALRGKSRHTVARYRFDRVPKCRICRAAPQDCRINSTLELARIRGRDYDGVNGQGHRRRRGDESRQDPRRLS